jgi:hypothetical protein
VETQVSQQEQAAGVVAADGRAEAVVAGQMPDVGQHSGAERLRVTTGAQVRAHRDADVGDPGLLVQTCDSGFVADAEVPGQVAENPAEYGEIATIGVGGPRFSGRIEDVPRAFSTPERDQFRVGSPKWTDA